MPPTKDARLEARLTHEQDELLRRAAAARGMPLSAFVLDAALERARQVEVLDNLTVLPEGQRADFAAWLDAPAVPIPEMERLARVEPFDDR